jgi:hypothetical protein
MMERRGLKEDDRCVVDYLCKALTCFLTTALSRGERERLEKVEYRVTLCRQARDD